MAFGFGFNKQKVLAAAEKYVQQGKLQNAIAEYEKILKNDPKDLTVTNTVGDLYARIGENDKATECFKNVGDAYAAQGFTVKGIAMYKKISKLKPSLESVLKLAELYTQQGLFNDARAQYLQVAEEFLRAGELEQSVRIFQKILEMDPDNVAMRVRLAEVYIRLGKKDEAWQIFSAAAENLRNRGSLQAAEEILQRMLALDPANSHALILRGRNALESGDSAAAIQYLEKTNLEAHPDGMRDLFRAYLQANRINDAGILAAKLLSEHNDSETLFTYLEALVQGGFHDEALLVIDQNADRLLAEKTARVQEMLHGLIGHMAGNAGGLEKVLELLRKSGDTSHVNEATELLAHACVQSGDLAKARELWQQLAEQEPQNPMHVQNLQQVMGMMAGGSGSRLITVEEGVVLVDELETTSPSLEPQYSKEIAKALRSALTDAELFISYNMPEKAMGPLVAALPIAPQDARLNQRLAGLFTRMERFAEAAGCCRTLEQAYQEAGYSEEAGRYGELAQRYEQRSSMGALPEVAATPVIPPAVAATSWPVRTHEAPEAVAGEELPTFEISLDEPAAEAEGAEVTVEADAPEVEAASETSEEIDLSSEWESGASEEGVHDASVEESGEAAVEDPAVAEAVEEIRFYIEHSMLDQARAAFAKLEALTGNTELLGSMLAELEAGPAATEEPAAESDGEPEATFAEASAEEEGEAVAHEIPADEAAMEEAGVAEAAPAEASEAEYAIEIVEPAESSEPEAHEIEFEVETHATAATDPSLVGHLDFMSSVPQSAAHEHEPEVVAEARPAHAEHAEQVKHAEEAVAAAQHALEEAGVHEANQGALGEFVADLEQSLGDGFMQEPGVVQPEHGAVSARHVPRAAEREPAVVASAAPAVPKAPAVPVVPVAQPVTSPGAAAAAAPAREVAAPAAVPPAPAFRTAVRPEPAAAAQSAAGVDLADMFGELKHELEEDTAKSDEDPETHYNLGVAFREMGLLDEAIGELQKVCQSVEHGHPFPHIMQTYTWLAQCFLDKGVPEAAIRWYDKALKLPNLDQDTRTALHYELASSYETAQDRDAALRHFMEVYGSNIDYRDVGERIKALRS
jgi:tetratricopeptide (TPR) repeat protein